jgi:two-component system, chemotaxis family, chemotaxis protein CheY
MAFTVLIVDDSPAMRSFVKRIVTLSGFDIGAYLEASNGREALDVLRNNWVDIILTDINMPVMNGQEFVRRLEEDAELRLIPVLVISTDRTEDRIREMMDLGARSYITKPFQPEALRQELETLLEASYARS